MRMTVDDYLEQLISIDGDMTTAISELIESEGSDVALRFATSWGGSQDPVVRGIALAILADIADEEIPGAATVILEQARNVVLPEKSVWLRSRAVSALTAVAHVLPALSPPDAADVRSRALAELMRFVQDDDSDVRLHMAFGLPCLLGDPSDPADPWVDALVGMLRDSDPDVQDWATFAFMKGISTDSPRIRDELLAVAAEGDPAPAAGQAAEALAQRGDARVLPILLRELALERVLDEWVSAAIEIPDPVLLPALENLQAMGWPNSGIAAEVTSERDSGARAWLDRAVTAARDARGTGETA